MVLSGCTDDGAYVDHDEELDFEDVPTPGDGKADVSGLPATFDRHLIMDDDQFTNTAAIDAAGLQQFFEDSPYGNRSWLASHTVSGMSAAEAIVGAAQEAGLNPLMMVARMQVEKSLVSKSTRPSQRSIDYAFGCGCPDNRPCNTAFKGLDKQVKCAADTLKKWYERSIAGDGLWVLGRAKRTLDPLSVTPRSHATASLYAYTPWVLVGRGGNWLTWNVLRRYAVSLDERGLLSPP